MAAHDAREQYFLELVNRARMNPAGEAARFVISLNKDVKSHYQANGEAPVYLTSTPKQVLAGNDLLNNSATSHSTWMLAKSIFSHTGVNGTMPWDRMQAAGYNWGSAGENISWSGSTGSFSLDAAVSTQHAGLFRSVGHRINILNDNYKEIGIGSVGGTFNGYNAMMSTQNFGTSQDAGAFVTGVAYKDTYNDNFYSMGEGQGSITAKLYSGNMLLTSTTTASAGGYALKTTTNGTIEMVFSGGTAAGSIGAKFSLGSRNVKIDLVDNDTIETNVTVTLTRDAMDARLIGIENKALYGNDHANVLIGNCGKNALSGGLGNDTLMGKAGEDSLWGGAGADKFSYYSTAEGGDVIKDFAEGDKVSFVSAMFGHLAKGELDPTMFYAWGSYRAHDANDRFIFNTTTDALYYDSNGTTAGGCYKIASFENGFTLSANDIVII
jgi:Ca2+-binding RTX toxin-like protein